MAPDGVTVTGLATPHAMTEPNTRSWTQDTLCARALGIVDTLSATTAESVTSALEGYDGSFLRIFLF